MISAENKLFISKERRDEFARRHPGSRKFTVRNQRLNPKYIEDAPEHGYVFNHIFGGDYLMTWPILYGVDLNPPKKKGVK